jgi:hypothetical protein
MLSTTNNNIFKSHVNNLRGTIMTSRQTLQKALTFARIMSKKYKKLKSVQKYHSSGLCYYPEKFILQSLPLSSIRYKCPIESLHRNECVYCQNKYNDLNNIINIDRSLYQSKESIDRFKNRQYSRRMDKLKIARYNYHIQLKQVTYNIKHLKERINHAKIDLTRVDIQVKQIKNGTYNTEMAFMTTRQKNDVIRTSKLFKTTSVHTFGQELELTEAKPTLLLELKRATLLLHENQRKYVYLKRHPLILHSFSRLFHWWHLCLRKYKGKIALKRLKIQLNNCHISEQILLKKWLYRKMSTRIQNSCRCYRARLELYKLQQIKIRLMSKRIYLYLRDRLFQKKRNVLLIFWKHLYSMYGTKLKDGWNIWCWYVFQCQRRDALYRFKIKWEMHFAALKIQLKFRMFMRINRTMFANTLYNKHLYKYIKCRIDDCTKENKNNKNNKNNQTYLTYLTQNNNSILVLNKPTFQVLLVTLKELQERTKYQWKKLMNSKMDSKTNSKMNSKKYNTIFNKGIKPIPSFYTSRFRGIGRIIKEKNDIKKSSSGGQCIGGGESYEWLLLQSINKRYLSCQYILDFITKIYSSTGYKIDLIDHRRLLRDFLRSLDPNHLHNINKTKLRMRKYYFSYNWINISLCVQCYSMFRVENTKCLICGYERYKRNKLNMTYSQILKYQKNDITFEPQQPGQQPDHVMIEDESLEATPNLRLPLKTRPKSLSDIKVEILPFLIHAHFFAISPLNIPDGLYGTHNMNFIDEKLKGRNNNTKYLYWNRSVKETKKWSTLLIKKYHVRTIEKLALWSETRLINIGKVPPETASKICLLLSMLQREMNKWMVTNGESLTIVDPSNVSTIEQLKLNRIALIPGSSIESVPEEFQ